MVAVEKSSLWNLIKDVKALDLSVVQRDVPPETVDAMKRTISGILGMLPSDKCEGDPWLGTLINLEWHRSTTQKCSAGRLSSEATTICLTRRHSYQFWLLQCSAMASAYGQWSSLS
uniref:Uncharacterized protein n=1 Tax=Triticum urartu TaxID=4572 RepID=A0A8R7QUX6_TRIUA